MRKSPLLLVAISLTAMTAAGQNPTIQPVAPCNGRFCGIDAVGVPQECCECNSIFNDSECCFSPIFCRCVISQGIFGGTFFCTTSCPCDHPDVISRPSPEGAIDKPIGVWQFFSPINIYERKTDEILEQEVEGAEYSLAVEIPNAQMTELCKTVVRTLTPYFTNDVASYLSDATRNGETLCNEKRRAIIVALDAEGWLDAAVAKQQTDVEILTLIWHYANPYRPWNGVVLGESKVLVFRAAGRKELEEQLLRRSFRMFGGSATTWHPVYGFCDLRKNLQNSDGKFAEFLIYISQSQSNRSTIVPYVLRLHYNEATGAWQRDSLWMFGSEYPKLLF